MSDEFKPFGLMYYIMLLMFGVCGVLTYKQPSSWDWIAWAAAILWMTVAQLWEELSDKWEDLVKEAMQLARKSDS